MRVVNVKGALLKWHMIVVFGAGLAAWALYLALGGMVPLYLVLGGMVPK
jgi:hypothetical protein